MAVAIVHYHLRRGGVTRVIEAQSQALIRAGVDHIILSGTPYQGRADLPVAIIPALDYRPSKPFKDPNAVTENLREVAAIALGKPVEIWHIHNPTLAKNVFFPDLVRGLSVSRERLVLHFHDFAEDGRPQNYKRTARRQRLYPVGPHIRYAFINSRDRAHLVTAGVPIEHTLLLPNAVVPPEKLEPVTSQPDPPATDSQSEAERRLVLYPVRGIRRKNLGEICLLAGLAPPGTRFATTLAPENPEWHAIHDQWARFAEEHRLPVQFGVVGNSPPSPGVDPTYQNWLSHATHLVTTSIAEGFGMAFLEPIALHKPLLGRDLPEITRDFRRDQIALGRLYDQLLVPVDWIDQCALFQELEQALQATYRRHGATLSPVTTARAGIALLRDGYFDYGNLPERFQRDAAARAFQDPGQVLVSIENERQAAIPWLAESLRLTAPAAPSSALDRYSISRYTDLLLDLYRDLLNSDSAPPKWLDKSKVLHQFLQPERFHFLRPPEAR